MKSIVTPLVQLLHRRILRGLYLAMLLGLLLTVHASGQKLEKITEMKVVYWRAFHGTIEQELGIDQSGALYLTTYIYQSENSGKPNVLTKDLSQKALNKVIHFVNDPEMRRSFGTSKPVIQPDGSTIEITVRENSFGLVFASQNAFHKNATKADQKLGAVVLDLIKEAGISIPKEDQY